ncbi:MAG: glycosyltransferase [Bacilli bacterium]
MKVLLYLEPSDRIFKTGIGQAYIHQQKALTLNNIEYTTNPNDEYDILHINTYGPKSYALMKKAKKAGKKIVIHAHAIKEYFKDSFRFSNQVAPIFKKWLIKCYKYGDYIITPTPYSKRKLESYGIRKPIISISNGVDLKAFEYNKKIGEHFREHLGFESKDKIIMSVGLFYKRKGVLDFIEIAKRLPEYKFIWFGDIPKWLPTKVRKVINDKYDNLYFPGFVEPELLKAAYFGADLFLFPSYDETEGIVVLEALASSQKLLVRDISVYEDWLEDGKNVYKAKNVNDCVKKTKKIINCEVKNLTSEGYKVAKEKDLKIIGKKLLKVYKEVLKK